METFNEPLKEPSRLIKALPYFKVYSLSKGFWSLWEPRPLHKAPQEPQPRDSDHGAELACRELPAASRPLRD